jgi:hypothetical protein
VPHLKTRIPSSLAVCGQVRLSRWPNQAFRFLPVRNTSDDSSTPNVRRLGDLAAWWLELRCGRGHLAYYPLRLLAAEHGWQKPLGDVLPAVRARAAPNLTKLTSGARGFWP